MDDRENVEYFFNGDVSSLSVATETAISLLDKYSARVKQLSNANAFSQGQQLSNIFPRENFEFQEIHIPNVSASSRLHSKLSSIIDNLRSRFRRETEAIEEEDSKLKNKNRTVDDSARRHGNLKSVLSDLARLFGKESSRFSSFAGFISLATKATSGLNKILTALTGLKLGDWLAQGVSKSIEFVENLNLFKVALGESIDKGLEFVDTMAEIYGMDPSNLYRYTGYFYQLTDAIGMTDEASSVMSLSLTKAANDIASLFNTDIETTVKNLASGMQGMARAVRKYGMDIRTVTLQQTALNYGITTQVQNMSEANRQALRYLTMMEQVKNATQQVVDPTLQASGVMGDFARNIETPANQLRIFKEQITQLGRAIGNFFIPVISRLLPVLNGFIMALRTILTFLFSLTGFKLDFGGASTGAASISKIGDAATSSSKALKELKNTIAPFDEINLLNAPKSSKADSGDVEGVLDPALLDAIESMSLGLEDIQMKANRVRDSLLKFFGFDYVEVFNPDTGKYEKKLQWFSDVFRENLLEKFPQWTKTINSLFDNWTSIVSGFKKVFKSLGGVIDTVKKKMISFLQSLKLDDKFSEAIDSLPGSLERISAWISGHQDQIANFIIILGSLRLAFKAFSAVSTFLTPLVTLGSAIPAIISALSGVLVPITAITGAIALLYTNSESFATSFNNLFGVIASSLDPVSEAVLNFVDTVWESLQDLWNNNLQPMIASIGDAAAPILDTLAIIWESLSTTVSEIVDTLTSAWTQYVEPTIAEVSDAITSIANFVESLWVNYIGPVIEKIAKEFPALYREKIEPIVLSIFDIVSTIVSGIIEVVSDFWENVLKPIISWLANVFGPTIDSIVKSAGDVFSVVFDDIDEVLTYFKGIISGIVDFLSGVFTGDWERAWEGIKSIVVNVANGIASTFEIILNGIVLVLNTVIGAIWSSLQAVTNGILSVVNDAADLLGFSVNLNWGSPPPQIGTISIPRVPMARGGVVTGPTNALIGEGRYDEAVIPLGNSPQMEDFANKIASKVGGYEQTELLREQNSLLRQLIQQTGESIGIRDLTGAITRIQRREARAGGYL